MKSILKHLSFSNIWIGLAASLLCLSNLLSLRWLPNMEMTQLSIFGSKYLLLFVFFATTAAYTFIRLIGLREKHPNASSEMIDYVRANKTLLSIWAILCALITGYCFYKLFMVQMIIILFAGLLSALYAIPIYKHKNEWHSLRQIPYLKTILVALVWSLMTVSCVLVYADMYPVIVRPQHVLLFFINFIFIWALTIPFDIRDMEYDKEIEVKTISHLLGVEKTKWFSIGLLIVYLILSFMFYIYIPCDIKYQTFFRSFNLAVFTASLAGGLAAIFLIKSITTQSKESVFTIELDGIIIAQSVFMIAIYSVYYFFK